jgi:hypothetical protein
VWPQDSRNRLGSPLIAQDSPGATWGLGLLAISTTLEPKLTSHHSTVNCLPTCEVQNSSHIRNHELDSVSLVLSGFHHNQSLVGWGITLDHLAFPP